MGNSDIVCDLLAKIYNKSKDNQNFPTSMKLADVIPVYKPNEKNERVFKKNYRPASLTPIVSKVFERNMFNEISQYIDKFLSPYFFRYRKGHSTEQCLVTMIELHPSVLKIKENVEIAEKFNFKNISSNQMMDDINKLNPKKACIGNDIPTKILIGNSDIVCEPISNIYNNSTNKQEYPISLKIADVNLF